MKDLKIVKQYIISNSTYVIQGHLLDGKLLSLVFDKDGYTLVNVKPNILIGRALKKINSSYAHARDISKDILGNEYRKLPLVVSNYFGQPIIMFPLFSPGSKDNIWVNFNPITNIGGRKDSIVVEFNHNTNSTFTFDVSRQTFNNQYVNSANLFKRISQQWRF